VQGNSLAGKRPCIYVRWQAIYAILRMLSAGDSIFVFQLVGLLNLLDQNVCVRYDVETCTLGKYSDHDFIQRAGGCAA
jgi:hypothetical protein